MSYSIDWPIGFKSRTCDPADKCFVGSKRTDVVQSSDTVKKSQAPWADPNKRVQMEAQKLRISSRGYAVYDAVKRCGPIPRSAIACQTQIKARVIDEWTLKLVRSGVLNREVRKNRESFYSIGKTPVVEVQ